MIDPANRNTLWASIFVDELARAGLRSVCIAPGSRSTPLTVAFSRRDDIQIYSLLDERGAGYFALGLALESGQPAALVCTSGTAAANFFPAVVEASQSQIPLLVLTADRPHPLRGSGANQTIDQVKMFGGYVRMYAEAPPPIANADKHTLRALRTLADRALASAAGFGQSPGPVQVNFPFAKPLDPVVVPGDTPAQAGTGFTGRKDGAPLTRISSSPAGLTAGQCDQLADILQHARRGLIVCGPRCPAGEFPQAVSELARAAGLPILADPLSGLRFGEYTQQAAILGAYAVFLEHSLPDTPPPDLVLRFGALPTSKALNAYLGSLPEDCQQIAIREHAVWADADFRLSRFYATPPAQACQALTDRTGKQAALQSNWLRAWQDAETSTWAFLQKNIPPEGQILADVIKALPAGGRLVAANSLAVRHLDEFAAPTAKPLRVFANRGASGIDGTTSTALGVAAVSRQPTVLVTGDLSFLHDLNGLLALKRCNLRMSIVLINNDGGGIFERLPIAGFEPPFTDLFRTPHGLDFAPAAAMFGLQYRRAPAAQVETFLKQALKSEQPVLLEIRTDAAQSEALRRQIGTLFQEEK